MLMIAPGGGPIKTIPAAARALANWAFSDRNPYLFDKDETISAARVDDS